MAAADYRLCDVCDGKVFYDADLNYEHGRDDEWAKRKAPFRWAGEEQGKPENDDWLLRLDYLGDWAVICQHCAKTHKTIVVPIEQERSEQAKADDSMLQWIKLTDRMPNPHGRVLIFTEGYDFNGEQVFDVKAETLNECFYADPDDQPEVCRVASRWMPHPTEWRPCECESQYDD